MKDIVKNDLKKSPYWEKTYGSYEAVTVESRKFLLTSGVVYGLQYEPGDQRGESLGCCVFLGYNKGPIKSYLYHDPVKSKIIYKKTYDVI